MTAQITKIKLPLLPGPFTDAAFKTWHSKDDLHLRKGMIYIMLKLLESITEKYLETSKLKLLTYIELGLYVDATSLEEYADISTLKIRMIALVRMKQKANGTNKNMGQVL